MQKERMNIRIALMICICLLVTGCASRKIETAVATHPVQNDISPEMIAARERANELARIETQNRLNGLENELKLFVNTNIRFGYDSMALTPEAEEIIKAKANFLINHPDVSIIIEGHCDERGSVEYNLALGDRRAKTAQDALIALGIAPDRTSTISYGKERPLYTGHTEEAWAKNRRDQFIIVKR
jgi:peptidoglycan-associated lipoprotein